MGDKNVGVRTVDLCLISVMLREKIDLRQPASHSDSPRTWRERVKSSRQRLRNTLFITECYSNCTVFLRRVFIKGQHDVAAAGLTGRAAAASPAAGTSPLSGPCDRGVSVHRSQVLLKYFWCTLTGARLRSHDLAA